MIHRYSATIVLVCFLATGSACKRIASLGIEAEMRAGERVLVQGAIGAYRAESTLAVEATGLAQAESAFRREARVNDELMSEIETSKPAVRAHPAASVEDSEARAFGLLQTDAVETSAGEELGAVATANVRAEGVNAGLQAAAATRVRARDLAISDLGMWTNELALVAESWQELPLPKRIGVLASLRKGSTPAAFRQIERNLKHGKVAGYVEFELAVVRHQLVTTRDVTVDLLYPRLPLDADLTKYRVVVDDRFLLAHGGLQHQLSDPMAEWRKRKDVHLDRLGPIDELPDTVRERSLNVIARPVESTKRNGSMVVLVWQSDDNSQRREREHAH
jgi:hypothetical protein